MKQNQKLELNWIGKGEEPKLEPRILIEQPEYSYGDPGSGNMLIQGDNLLALKALEQDYAGKVKCIYIDPPYNTGNAFEHYDDGIEHSQWLNLMAPRLKILRDLLSNDGSIWISIDDNEAHYLKVIMDEIFGRKNFVANVIWEKRTSRENRRAFSFNHDHVIVYGKDKSKFEEIRNPLGLSDEVLSRYKNPDNDPRGAWQSISVNAQAGHATDSQFYKLRLPSGRELDPPKGRCWLYTVERMQQEIVAGNIWFGANGDNVPRVKKFLRDNENKGLTPETIWYADEVGTNDDAKKAQIQLLPDIPVFDNPKPEGLLERVIHIASNPDDLVLDSFLGSGTTAAVAHKMGRKWIGIELGEHAKTHCYPRLKQVVDGTDQGGISKAVEWQGGGGFRFYTLAPSLLNRDKYGNWIISKKYNPDMLAAAMAKQEGFRYLPDEHVYWKQARSSEKDFLFTTTGFMTVEMLDGIHEEMQPDESLLLACKAYQKECAHRHSNISIKKIPNMLLGRCEFGREDYSLNIVQVPYDRAEEEVPDEPELAIESEEVEESRQTDLFE